ncbi:MAG: 6,7-dimethyl-8-ribityllumazine synthase [Burkholderiales bacterium]|jgi:6,7-dimethyl-8-ribityllumazine synthase|nr:6,7-dimethyl-8-ribityllumazine synthase [Burkholderiales bacterium]
MKQIGKSVDGNEMRIGIVRARFNEEVGLAELEACRVHLMELGVHDDDITVVSVPGALEVPLVLRELAATEDFDALIALGAVIRGETYHFEIVSNESASGITQVQLDTGIPVANGILTVDTDEQAMARAPVKGKDCAEAAVEMANLLRRIDHDYR